MLTAHRVTLVVPASGMKAGLTAPLYFMSACQHVSMYFMAPEQLLGVAEGVQAAATPALQAAHVINSSSSNNNNGSSSSSSSSRASMPAGAGSTLGGVHPSSPPPAGAAALTDWRQVDVWALGLTWQDMLLPPAADEQPMRDAAHQGSWAAPTGWPADLADLVGGMLQVDPRKRLSMAQVQAHPFFAGVDWEEVAAGRTPVPALLSVGAACAKKVWAIA